MKLSHRQGQGAQPARKQIREAQLSSCWAAAAPASAGLVLQAHSEDRLHVPRTSQETHHVATWWSFLGNPSSTCGETLTALPSLISIFSLTSLAKQSVFPEQLTDPVNGADSCTHTLSLVQPHLPVKSSLPSKPFCNSLCKLQYNYIFPPVNSAPV